ncbi:DUF2238 domain-containing protein [Acinetobacter larvae]|uniref:DUF2238 domain-containing protein n=1 Tax=Acinetobacter larvae TaxID=1789224 RepID=A0A1B2M1T1_9GAMM|nr:DUF2238 domain-containing protein [Acinetobacter larvae]AOA58983.1 hypothetical protein BFG52_11895 [Acinetobacter larvae]
MSAHASFNPTLTFKHWLALSIIILCMLIASIQPLDLQSYALHQLGTLLMLIALLCCQKYFALQFQSFVLYLIFLAIHILGAHYLYSYVPYNDWAIQYLHFDLQQTMGWQRNMYDRLVHFSYGLLLYPFFIDIFKKIFRPLPAKLIILLVIQWVMVTSLMYEWIEWGIALTMSPEAAEQYNGQQGDIWDAHQDMLMATLGAICMSLIIYFSANNTR